MKLCECQTHKGATGRLLSSLFEMLLLLRHAFFPLLLRMTVTLSTLLIKSKPLILKIAHNPPLELKRLPGGSWLGGVNVGQIWPSAGAEATAYSQLLTTVI